MIAEFTIENLFSIKSAQKISFVPSADAFMSDEYSYEVKEGIRLLKAGIIYGLVVNLGRPTVYTRRETFAHVVFPLLFF